MNPNRQPQMLLPVLPWWRVPTVWLFLAGPASVVLACVVTAVFVLHGADRVVRDDEPAVDPVVAATPQAPAQAGRNHVSSTLH
jgi:hypothetical protein